MGNSLGRRKRVKVMKIDGSITKIKQPATAGDVLQSYPGHVILESEQVKLLGHEAKPLEPDVFLKSSKLYFVVRLPEPPLPSTSEPGRRRLSPRRVRSGINMSAKDRLESLKLARRSSSDISFARPSGGGDGGSGPLRISMRLPRAEVARLVEQSKDPAEAAQRILDLCVEGSRERSGRPVLATPASDTEHSGPLREKKEKRMRFVLPEDEPPS